MINKCIISNWKLNGSKQLLKDLLIPLNNFFIKNDILKLNLIITPPFIYLFEARRLITHPNIILGAQNVDIYLNGPYTGDTSIHMLKDIGIKYVIVGHSERRLHHNESSVLIAKKFKLVKEFGLIPILCIGETLTEYELQTTKLVCKKQIDSIFKELGTTTSAFNNTIIAYEPVWAIGSGKIPSLHFISDVINFIKGYIFKIQDSHDKNFYIQYGGSVSLENINLLSSFDNLDGLLVGSASLNSNNFLKIIAEYSKN